MSVIPRSGCGRSARTAAAAPSSRQQPPGLGRDALAADLVAREARLVEQQHVVAALAQEDRGGRARGPAAHHDDVATLASRGLLAPPPAADRASGADLRTGMPAAAKAAPQLAPA